MPFTCQIHSPRWGHPDEYLFTRTTNGWHIRGGGSHERNCNARGESPGVDGGIRGIFSNDMIHMPADLPECLEMLWNWLENGEINEDQAQAEITVLAAWINATTESAPRTGEIAKHYGRTVPA